MSWFDDLSETMSKSTPELMSDVDADPIGDAFDFFSPQAADSGSNPHWGEDLAQLGMNSMWGADQVVNHNKPHKLAPVTENPFSYLYD